MRNAILGLITPVMAVYSKMSNLREKTRRVREPLEGKTCRRTWLFFKPLFEF